jgi:hypothetical protein
MRGVGYYLDRPKRQQLFYESSVSNPNIHE